MVCMDNFIVRFFLALTLYAALTGFMFYLVLRFAKRKIVGVDEMKKTESVYSKAIHFGDKFKRIGLNSYVYDINGDYIFNGHVIVPVNDCVEFRCCTCDDRFDCINYETTFYPCHYYRNREE